MKHIEKIVELAENELGSIAQAGKLRSREDVDTVYKLMDVIKDGYCIMDMVESGNSYEDGSYRSYGNSYRSSRARDSMGRYSRDGGSYRGYSRADYSGDRGEFMERLQNLMEYSPDEQTRQSLNRMLEQMHK